MADESLWCCLRFADRGNDRLLDQFNLEDSVVSPVVNPRVRLRRGTVQVKPPPSFLDQPPRHRSDTLPGCNVRFE